MKLRCHACRVSTIKTPESPSHYKRLASCIQSHLYLPSFVTNTHQVGCRATPQKTLQPQGLLKVRVGHLTQQDSRSDSFQVTLWVEPLSGPGIHQVKAKLDQTRELPLRFNEDYHRFEALMNTRTCFDVKFQAKDAAGNVYPFLYKLPNCGVVPNGSIDVNL